MHGTFPSYLKKPNSVFIKFNLDVAPIWLIDLLDVLGNLFEIDIGKFHKYMIMSPHSIFGDMYLSSYDNL